MNPPNQTGAMLILDIFLTKPPKDWWRNNCRVRTQIWQFGKKVYYISNHFFWRFCLFKRRQGPNLFHLPSQLTRRAWADMDSGSEVSYGEHKARAVLSGEMTTSLETACMSNDIWCVWLSSASPINNIQYFWVSRSLCPMASVAKDR